MRLACGHVDAELPASAIGEVATLVSDAIAGRLQPRAFARASERAVTFERGIFCFTARRDDPELRKGSATASAPGTLDHASE